MASATPLSWWAKYQNRASTGIFWFNPMRQIMSPLLWHFLFTYKLLKIDHRYSSHYARFGGLERRFAMSNEEMMKQIAKDLFSLKREYEEGRIGISHKVLEAENFIRKFSFQKVRTFPNDDPAILEEAKRLLRNGKSVFFLVRADAQQYELYQKDW
jgi:hypothetical protein